MNEQWMEEIKHNDVMIFLEKYFPGQSFGNKTEQIAELCRIAEKSGFTDSESIRKIVSVQIGEDAMSFHDETIASDGRRIIGKKYISDVDASKSGACKACLEYAGRIFKWPEEADKMPVLPRHPNCKCKYENIYEPKNKQSFQTKIQQFVMKYINTKVQIQKILLPFIDKATEAISEMRMANSFDVLQTLKNSFRPTINHTATTMNVMIEILKEILYAIDFFLGFIAQATPMEGLRKNIESLREWAKSVRQIYEDIRNIHYERLDLLIQQIHYLPKNPKEARSISAQKAGWRKATDNENWYHRNNGGKNNVKYYNTKTGQEVVYDSNDDNAKIVTSVDNIGTYNHYPPNDAVKHALFDVIPYWLWGNAENDNTSLGNRLLGN